MIRWSSTHWAIPWGTAAPRRARGPAPPPASASRSSYHCALLIALIVLLVSIVSNKYELRAIVDSNTNSMQARRSPAPLIELSDYTKIIYNSQRVTVLVLRFSVTRCRNGGALSCTATRRWRTLFIKPSSRRSLDAPRQAVPELNWCHYWRSTRQSVDPRTVMEKHWYGDTRLTCARCQRGCGCVRAHAGPCVFASYRRELKYYWNFSN